MSGLYLLDILTNYTSLNFLVHRLTDRSKLTDFHKLKISATAKYKISISPQLHRLLKKRNK